MYSHFLSRPAQLEEKISQWQQIAGDSMNVEYEVSYSGHKVYAITLSNFSVPQNNKKVLYVAQPHAHEPGATAGIIDVIEQLVTGKDLAGNVSNINREQVLNRAIITFNPIGNPFGSEKSPYLYWDGTKVINQQFYCIMLGENPQNAGKMWQRLDIFDTREVETPNPIGIVYEQIDEYRYVEPNRSQLSSFFKLFHRMDARYHYQYWLDLHQTEYANSSTQCQLLLPLEDLPREKTRAETDAWARQVTEAWRAAGYVTEPPTPLPYTGEQAEYFRRNWGEIDQRLSRITTEVRNNSPELSPIGQMKAQGLAIEITLQRLAEMSVIA